MNRFVKQLSCLILIALLSSTTAQTNGSVQIVPVAGHLHKITCNYGNVNVNTLASIGKDGILLIDTGVEQTAGELKSVLENYEDSKLSVIINTHPHPDHIGGNSLLSQNPVQIIAHQNVRNRLTGFYGKIRNVPAEKLPGIVFNDSLTLYFNDEEIKLLYSPGHTDSDIIVHFTKSKIVFMGDLLFSNGFPSVEVNVGGNIEQYLLTLRNIINRFPDDTKFIAGHGRDYNRNELEQYYQIAVNTTNAIRNGIRNGNTVDEMREAKILDKWEPAEATSTTADYWIGAVAGSLTSDFKPSIAEPILSVLENNDAKAAIEKYNELKKNRSENYVFVENELNNLGYYLLGKERIKDAIEIFKMNVREYPESFNVYDSLGEAYMIGGNTKEAVKNYNKSLELNPDNANAVMMLKKLTDNN